MSKLRVTNTNFFECKTLCLSFESIFNFNDILMCLTAYMSILYIKIIIFRIYERLGYRFKSVKFAGGKQNRKFLVVFDDRVDTWEINTLGLVSV